MSVAPLLNFGGETIVVDQIANVQRLARQWAYTRALMQPGHDGGLFKVLAVPGRHGMQHELHRDGAEEFGGRGVHSSQQAETIRQARRIEVCSIDGCTSQPSVSLQLQASDAPAMAEVWRLITNLGNERQTDTFWRLACCIFARLVGHEAWRRCWRAKPTLLEVAFENLSLSDCTWQTADTSLQLAPVFNVKTL
jgi:hypothetical protein